MCRLLPDIGMLCPESDILAMFWCSCAEVWLVVKLVEASLEKASGWLLLREA